MLLPSPLLLLFGVSERPIYPSHPSVHLKVFSLHSAAPNSVLFYLWKVLPGEIWGFCNQS